MKNLFIEEPVPVEDEEASKLQQCKDFLVTLSDETYKDFLEMMKVARSTEKKMKEVEKKIDEDAEKELNEFLEDAEDKLSRSK